MLLAIFLEHSNSPKHIGYVSQDREWIYIGHGEWIPYKSYCNIKFGAKQPSQFVKQMAIAVYGVDTLVRSTISGKGSNRNKQQVQPQETLNPIKLLAIKDIYRYYLTTVLRKSSSQADMLVDKVRHHISHKIAKLKSQIDKKRTSIRPRMDIGQIHNIHYPLMQEMYNSYHCETSTSRQSSMTTTKNQILFAKPEKR